MAAHRPADRRLPRQLSVDALIHLIYASTALRRLDAPALLGLLEQSRQDNAACGVTGLLLHEDGHFFQVLEGPQSVVEALYARIRQDPRHHKTVLIVQEPIARRAFGDWRMAFDDVSAQQLAGIEGLADFFSAGSCFAELGSGRAKKLLAAFKRGRWRARLAVPAALALRAA
jgi:hypothetical protein